MLLDLLAIFANVLPIVHFSERQIPMFFTGPPEELEHSKTFMEITWTFHYCGFLDVI